MLRFARALRCPSTSPTAAAAASSLYGSCFTISQRCWDRIHQKNAIDRVSNDQRFLRLSIESGGCHGFLYKFQFDSEFDAENGDVKFVESEVEKDAFQAKKKVQAEAAGVERVPATVVVDTTTAQCMSGAVLDYHSELKGSAFVVVGNEKVDHSCACAQSFSLKQPAK